jgi:putative FmdB family regulatory protein
MPVYEYACSACGHEFEEWQKMSDPPVRTCPKCKKKKVERLISQTAFQLKGGGWYADLYSSSKPGKGGSTGSSDASEGGGDKGSGGDKAGSGEGSKDSGSKDATSAKSDSKASTKSDSKSGKSAESSGKKESKPASKKSETRAA